MNWTYGGNPGTGTASQRRDAVRVLTGDTNIADQQLSDEAIAFNLSATSNDVYRAAALSARQIAATYARRASTTIESVSVKYQDLQKNYADMAARLDAEAARYGAGGLGLPRAGGISVAAMDAERSDSDRPGFAFRRDQFRHPEEDGETDEETVR